MKIGSRMSSLTTYPKTSPERVATGHEDGTVLQWKWPVRGSQFTLIWRSNIGPFMGPDLDLNGALNLGMQEKIYLKEHGAIGEPSNHTPLLFKGPSRSVIIAENIPINFLPGYEQQTATRNSTDQSLIASRHPSARCCTIL
mgnify:CR=1 FL=1